MKQILSFFTAYTDEILRYGFALLILLAGILLRKQLARGVLKLMGRVLFYKKPEFRSAFCDSLQKPLSAFFVVLGMILAFGTIPKTAAWASFGMKAFRVSVIVIITWGLANFITLAAHLIFKFSNLDSASNGTATKFLGNILRVVVIALGVVIIISELGYNINGLITGVGLGGLTFALAAQETASNLFGGFVIILDKPFMVGDWITTPTVDGVVEDITVRSTRIRTFANSLIIVPNSKLSNEPITNWSRMNKRRVKCSIGLTYDTTAETIQRCIERIDTAIRETEGVDLETIMVSFDEFAPSGQEIGILFFTKTIDWAEYMKIKEAVNFKIKEIVESEGAAFAFPSQSIYVEQMPEK